MRRLWLISAGIAAVCLAAVLVLRLTRAPGAAAEVRQNGRVIATLPLNEDASMTVYAPDGGSNTVTVSDGRVCVSHADCPDRLCVRQGWKSLGGESVVCLPHNLVILVKGGSVHVDAVAQ